MPCRNTVWYEISQTRATHCPSWGALPGSAGDSTQLTRRVYAGRQPHEHLVQRVIHSLEEELAVLDVRYAVLRDFCEGGSSTSADDETLLKRWARRSELLALRWTQHFICLVCALQHVFSLLLFMHIGQCLQLYNQAFLNSTSCDAHCHDRRGDRLDICLTIIVAWHIDGRVNTCNAFYRIFFAGLYIPVFSLNHQNSSMMTNPRF